ncbi:MAG: hypothetical protein M3Y57_19365 [Acidobacteriota bacterium]|nr:hypothetical protein [Acidobacteriota bacterium]
MARFRFLYKPVLLLAAVALLWAQQPPPRPRPPKPPGPAISDIRWQLNATKPVDVTAKRALQFSHVYLARAEKVVRSGQLFTADRLAEAADSLLHIAEHQQHLRTGGGPKGPPLAPEIQDHLQRVYFRIQQADYFLQQSHDSQAVSFPKWARDFYQLALRAYDRKDMVAADENAKCAEEVVKALENLAQAASPANIPPPPRPPAPPPAH